MLCHCDLMKRHVKFTIGKAVISGLQWIVMQIVGTVPVGITNYLTFIFSGQVVQRYLYQTVMLTPHLLMYYMSMYITI